MVKDVQLSKNFRLAEFVVSSEHPEAAGTITLNQPEIYKLKLLAATILQPVRERWGRIKITSACRKGGLNQLVGGDKKSQHPDCEAVDFVPLDADIEEVFHWIRFALPHAFHQLILECKGKKPAWIHVSIIPEKSTLPLRVFYQVNGKYHDRKPEDFYS